MLKKLSDEQLEAIVLSATEEFGKKGLSGANIGTIAKKADVSVGVIYKYYADKDALFRACIERSLNSLSAALMDCVSETDTPEVTAYKLAKTGVTFAKEHGECIRLYHEITAAGNSEHAKELADTIEADAARIYTEFMKKAGAKGLVRTDIDPAHLAFFFDNMLMMLHFSYGCDYYRERMRLYLGEPSDDNLREELIKSMAAFIANAVAP